VVNNNFITILEQFVDKERSTLGLSLDNDVVLKHPNPTDEG
jgi:hypothetical protein